MARIGFIGLGHMGLPMAINLLKAGHEVTGFDLQQEAVNQLRAAGGQTVTKLNDVGANQDVVITMLQTGQQVQEVCLHEGGLYFTMPAQSLHIDCSSIDVAMSRNLHEQAIARGLYSIDAPVSGGVAGATAGTLTFMIGGDANSVNLAMPILSAMGKKFIHTGQSGSGQAAKICNNLILGITMIGVSEAFKLAEKLGLNADKLHEVVSNSSGQCWVTNQYLPVPNVLPNVPANNGYEPGFTVAMMLKDLILSQSSAQNVGVNTTLGRLATSIYQKFSDAGYSNLDFSAIIKAID